MPGPRHSLVRARRLSPRGRVRGRLPSCDALCPAAGKYMTHPRQYPDPAQNSPSPSNGSEMRTSGCRPLNVVTSFSGSHRNNILSCQNISKQKKMAVVGANDSPAFFNQDMLKSLTAGGVAGAVSRSATAPLERVKVLQQINKSQYNRCPMAGDRRRNDPCFPA